jgi:hypothetical protein
MEPSKKYLIHCIAWNVLAWAALALMVWVVPENIFSDENKFFTVAVTIFFTPLVLFFRGVYLLWCGTSRRKMLVVGMLLSVFLSMFAFWGIDGYFQPPLSSHIFGGPEVRGYICGEEFPYVSKSPCPPK